MAREKMARKGALAAGPVGAARLVGCRRAPIGTGWFCARFRLLQAMAVIATAVLAGLIVGSCDGRQEERARIEGWSAAGLLGGLEVRERPALGAPPGGERTVSVAVTGDLKGWITNRTLYPHRRPAGLAHLAPLLRGLRVRDPHLILLDAGDAIRGAPSSTLFSEGGSAPAIDFPILELMNHLGYDAIALGNYDLSLGWASLAHALAASDFPWLAANLARRGGGTALPPYLILERGGVRVAILGMTTPRVVAGIDPRHLEDLVSGAPLQAAALWVPFLRGVERADLVIGLIHGGLDEGFAREAALRSGAPPPGGAGRVADAGMGFDLIVSGDAHRLSPRGTSGADSPYAVPVVEPGAFGNGLALVTFTLRERGGRWAVIRIVRDTLTAEVRAEPRALEVVEAALRRTAARLAESSRLRFRAVPRKGEFYRCAGALSHRTATFLAGGEGASFSLLPMRWRFEPPAKTEVGAPVRRAHLHRWMTYGDTLVQARLTGRQIELLLESYVRHVRKWRVPHLAVLWPGGLRVELAERGSRIVALRRAADGAALDPHRGYAVWLTAFVWNGGLGLAPRALLQPDQRLRALPPTLRAGMFALLSDPALELPEECRRWLGN